MAISVTDSGNIIKVTGTTDVAEVVTTNILKLVGILWYAPTAVGHLLSVTDTDGGTVILGKCVTANASNWWDLDGQTIVGLKIDDMDSGTVLIMVKHGTYKA